MSNHRCSVTLINVIFLQKTRLADKGNVSMLSDSDIKMKKKKKPWRFSQYLHQRFDVLLLLSPQWVSPNYTLDGVSSDCLQIWITFDFTSDLLIFLIATVQTCRAPHLSASSRYQPFLSLSLTHEITGPLSHQGRLNLLRTALLPLSFHRHGA